MAIGVVTLPAAAGAAPVRFPLTVEYELLQMALRKHLRDASGGALVLWRSADGCRTFTMQQPTVEPAQGVLKIAGPGSAQVGLGLLGYCWAQVGWDGHVEIRARPEIGRDWQLRLRVLDTQLYDASRQRSGVVPRVWETVKGWAESALPTFSFDLGPPVQEVKAVLGLFADPGRAGPLGAALQTLQPSDVAVEADGVKVGVTLELPDGAAPAPRAAEPGLTPAELKRWEAALERWDGFLTFVIKDLGALESDPSMRSELLDLLLGARHELTAVLGRGPEPGTDPVQRLFVGVWSQLRAMVRRAAGRAGDEARALRYLTFVAAGDALASLTAAAPALGLEISADGLRRFARTLDPVYAGDPLEYSELPDATLRQLFRFRDPDAPPRRVRRRAPSSWWWLGPQAAHAADADEWGQLGQRLDRWVPDQSELGLYRAAVDRLLNLAAERTFDPGDVDERFERLFHHLVKATAWQESCWRQFGRNRGTVTYLLSPTHDVGIMQINARIWRGFFNPEKLRWNAAYNTGAGAEILYNLLLRYGVREAGDRLDNAARATYSAYNGGPARYRRYRLGRLADAHRAVDRAFWQKYQLIAAGTAQDRVLCLPVGATSMP
ncbi:MAG TPA: transglycosylase SLT domain-containing protein [Methylomirabilota bacterium]|nr:transglycosylase SLT domain-containing protein [Methylomirabilota bacterium]